MLRKQQQLVAEAFRDVRAELHSIQSQSVQDSAEVYLTKLWERLAERYAARDRRFDRQGFNRACTPIA